MFHITSMQMARTDVKGVLVICPDKTDHINWDLGKLAKLFEQLNIEIKDLGEEPLAFFSLTFRHFVIWPKV